MNLNGWDQDRADYLDTVADADNNARACGENPRLGDFQGWKLSDGKFVRADSLVTGVRHDDDT